MTRQLFQALAIIGLVFLFFAMDWESYTISATAKSAETVLLAPEAPLHLVERSVSE